jgi:hypothetical protein
MRRASLGSGSPGSSRHCQRNGRASPSADQALQDRFDQLDALDARVRSAPTLEERRELVRELFAALHDADRAMRDDARRSGEDTRLTGLRCDEHTRVFLATLRDPCGWNFEEMMGEYNVTDGCRRDLA